MILGSSVWAGLHSALRLRQTQEQLRDLRGALELINGEIAFAATPFVPLCRRAGEGRCPGVRAFFETLAETGEDPARPWSGRTRLACQKGGLLLPEPCLRSLERLFDDFGRCDREGQLRQLALAGEELGRLSRELGPELEGRGRLYRWLGFTAGAALLVLVL